MLQIQTCPPPLWSRHSSCPSWSSFSNQAAVPSLYPGESSSSICVLGTSLLHSSATPAWPGQSGRMSSCSASHMPGGPPSRAGPSYGSSLHLYCCAPSRLKAPGAIRQTSASSAARKAPGPWRTWAARSRWLRSQG